MAPRRVAPPLIGFTSNGGANSEKFYYSYVDSEPIKENAESSQGG
jgi:hypothetical protein